MGQMVVDTTRNVIWLWGGVCQGARRDEMYYMKLNEDPGANSWTRVSPSQTPPYFAAAAIHDPDNDVIVSFGYDGVGRGRYTWVYCSTLQTATPGVLTTKQISAGCSAPDDWSAVSVAGGVYPQAGSFFPGLVYDSVDQKVILFGGAAPGPGARASETWSYDVPEKRWVNQKPATSPVYGLGAVTGTPLAVNAADGKVYFLNPAPSPQTWTYEYATNTWKQLCDACGPLNSMTVEYDSKRNVLVALAYGGPGKLELWVGTLGMPALACDLNNDGILSMPTSKSRCSKPWGPLLARTQTPTKMACATPRMSSR
jgi:hypothetical protein